MSTTRELTRRRRRAKEKAESHVAWWELPDGKGKKGDKRWVEALKAVTLF